MPDAVVQDLVVEQLKLLRGDVREIVTRVDQTNARLDQTNTRLDHLEQTMSARFEVIETTLRDLAQQMVVLGRGVHALLENRRQTDGELDDLRRRVAALEARVGM